MDGACSMHPKILLENLNVKDHMEDPGRKYDGTLWTGFI
jgi:hypothetical protein